MGLCFAKDRLYLVEASRRHDPLHGHRVLVLSLQGDILQVVTHPTDPTAEFKSICCFDRKLLAIYHLYEANRMHAVGAGLLALQGL